MLVRIASELEATGAVRFSMEPSSGFSKAILSHKRKEPKCGLNKKIIAQDPAGRENSPYAYTV
jgi:hypothetical protein